MHLLHCVRRYSFLDAQANCLVLYREYRLRYRRGCRLSFSLSLVVRTVAASVSLRALSVSMGVYVCMRAYWIHDFGLFALLHSFLLDSIL